MKRGAEPLNKSNNFAVFRALAVVQVKSKVSERAQEKATKPESPVTAPLHSDISCAQV